MVKNVLQSNGIPKSDHTSQELLLPLPPTKQRAGHSIGFFEQGLITGGLVTVSSLVAIVATGYWATQERY